MKVAETILTQLGGRRFKAMTGSKDFIAGEDYLGMKLVKNESKANYLKIELNGKDLYNMKFMYISMKGMKEVKIYNDIYSDQLQELFTDVTKLYTKF